MIYKVVEPCSQIADDQKSVTVHKTGALVELDDEQAAELADAVELVGGSGTQRRLSKFPPKKVRPPTLHVDKSDDKSGARGLGGDGGTAGDG
jgi:hypothetical protein